MVIKQDELKRMFRDVADIWKEHNEYLSKIDAKFGDGDHGVTIKKIARFVEQEIQLWSDKSMYDFVSDLGTGIMAVNGGSAGPLYGTMIGGFAIALEGVEEIDGAVLKAMFRDSLSEMQGITKAGIGDKTMMDALIPAVEAAESASDDIPHILLMAKEAAVRGAKDSEQFIAKYGRARSYKEQTIGTPDAGAVSTSLLFVGLEKFCSN